MKMTQQKLKTLLDARSLARNSAAAFKRAVELETQFGQVERRNQLACQCNQATKLLRELEDLLAEAVAEWEIELPLFADEEGPC